MSNVVRCNISWISKCVDNDMGFMTRLRVVSNKCPRAPLPLHPCWGQCDNMTRVDTTHQHTAGIRGGVSRPLLLLANKHAQSSEVLITSICHLLILLLWSSLQHCRISSPMPWSPARYWCITHWLYIDIQLLSARVTNLIQISDIQAQAVRGIREEVVWCDVDGVFKLCGWKWMECWSAFDCK